MNIAVVTTETLHHCYFLRELARVCPPAVVLAQRNGARPPFDTHHPFEDRRDEYERQTWFEGADVHLADFAQTIEIDSANDSQAVKHLARAQPDIVVLFGAGRIDQPVIDVCPEGIVNLHGGDPEEYRGLDSHLWATYHGDFDSIVTTLHRVNARIDDGEIVSQAPVPLGGDMLLHELRSRNTRVCVELVRSALEAFGSTGRFHSRPQRKRGRYYSFMPGVLKETCEVRFAHHAGGGS